MRRIGAAVAVVAGLASASGARAGEGLQPNERPIANAAYLLKFLYLTRAWRLEVAAPDRATLTGYGRRVDVWSPRRCVFDIGKRSESGELLSGVEIDFAAITGTWSTECRRMSCDLVFDADGAGVCYKGMGATSGWSCRKEVRLPDAARDRKTVRTAVATVQYFYSSGCRGANDSPRF